jgi:hypothetical protein
VKEGVAREDIKGSSGSACHYVKKNGEELKN